VGGVEVAARFRASEGSGKRTLLVATTALSTMEDRDTCLAAGMDAFITKPITPEKLRTVLADCGGSGLGAAAEMGPELPGPEVPGLKLTLIRHLAEGSPAGMGRELAAFAASLDEAVRGVTAARASGSRPAVSSAAHRVLSLARMVGAEPLAATAADIQDYASAYTDTELEEEIATLGRRADDLEGALARAAEAGSISPSWAS
jgi:CheY-like chemotaxis protein